MKLDVVLRLSAFIGVLGLMPLTGRISCIYNQRYVQRSAVRENGKRMHRDAGAPFEQDCDQGLRWLLTPSGAPHRPADDFGRDLAHENADAEPD